MNNPYRFLSAEDVLPQSSQSAWRRVHFETEQGKVPVFLSNGMHLAPGVIAFAI